MSPAEPLEDGQFDDAPEDVQTSLSATPALQPMTASADPRGGHSYIDDDAPVDPNINLDWSEDEELSEDETDEDEFENSFARVEDEDWEIAERGKYLYIGAGRDAEDSKTSPSSIIV